MKMNLQKITLIISIIYLSFSIEAFTPSYNIRGNNGVYPSSLVIYSMASAPMENEHIPNVLLVECGFGNDSHGQNSTKAAMKACRNAIEFNSLSINRMIPGGYDAMKVHVILGVPAKYQSSLNTEEVSKVFPFGDVKITVRDGGLVAPSGRVIESLGDKNDDMVIVCAAVQVGY